MNSKNVVFIIVLLFGLTVAGTVYFVYDNYKKKLALHDELAMERQQEALKMKLGEIRDKEEEALEQKAIEDYAKESGETTGTLCISGDTSPILNLMTGDAKTT